MIRVIRNYIILLSLFFGIQVRSQNGSDILKKMHTAFYQGGCRAYTFSQKNTHYRNDSVVGHLVWYEAIEYPDKFRIDFGDRSEGNYRILRNDSAYSYKKGSLVKTRTDSSALLLIIGGMYYRDLEDVLRRFKAANYTTDVLSLQKWNAEEVYVIGAKEGDINSNQIWVNKKTLQVVRILESINKTDLMDMRFEAHQVWCKGFVETKVSFRRNGKLEQTEEYYDIKESAKFPD